jgi:hypothetical protein
MWQGISALEAAALAEENAQLRRQLAERQQLAALRADAEASSSRPVSVSPPDAVTGQRQRVLGLDGTWVEQTWVMVGPANQVRPAWLAEVNFWYTPSLPR